MVFAAQLSAQSEGSLIWSYSLNGFSESSPALSADGETLYLGVERRTGGHVVAIPRDGRGGPRWVRNLPEGVSSSPAVGRDGTIYVGCDDGKLYALNPNGTIKWEFATRPLITSSAAIGDDGTIYFGGDDFKLHAIQDLGNRGEERWAFPTGDWIESSPAIGPDGTIYVGSNDKNLYAITPTGTEKWPRFATGGPIHASPAVGADGTIYVGSFDQKMYAIAPDGTKKWDYLTNGEIWSSAALGADGTIYFASMDLNFYALNPGGPDTQRVRWRSPLGVASSSTAAVRGDGIIIAAADGPRLFAFRPENGSVLWPFKGGSEDLVFSSPLVAPDGAIYLSSLDGLLYKVAGNGSPLSEYSSWPAFRRDVAHTGRSRAAARGQLMNISTRAQVGAGDTVVVGFFVQGVAEKVYLLRGIGPTLAQFGISDFMTDPQLDLFSGTHRVTGNNNWEESPPGFSIPETSSEVGAFSLPPASKDAALVIPLPPGLYTAQVTNAEGRTGVALIEAYDARGGDETARLVNVSTRGAVGATRENYLVAGVAVGGIGRSRLLVRGVGPGLAQFNVGGVLARPMMSVYAVETAGPRLIATNGGWTTQGFKQDLVTAAAAVSAFSLAESQPDAAMILSLDPGLYTVEISGVNNTTGQALVEMYVLP